MYVYLYVYSVWTSPQKRKKYEVYSTLKIQPQPIKQVLSYICMMTIPRCEYISCYFTTPTPTPTPRKSKRALFREPLFFAANSGAHIFRGFFSGAVFYLKRAPSFLQEVVIDVLSNVQSHSAFGQKTFTTTMDAHVLS